MILLFKYVLPSDSLGPTEPEPGLWVLDGQAPDDADLSRHTPGEYAVYVGTKSKLDEGPEAQNDLPTSFKFDRLETV